MGCVCVCVDGVGFKGNVYYSDFVCRDFLKHKTEHIEINVGLKNHLEALGGRKTPNNGSIIKRYKLQV